MTEAGLGWDQLQVSGGAKRTSRQHPPRTRTLRARQIFDNINTHSCILSKIDFLQEQTASAPCSQDIPLAAPRQVNIVAREMHFPWAMFVDAGPPFLVFTFVYLSLLWPARFATVRGPAPQTSEKATPPGYVT